MSRDIVGREDRVLRDQGRNHEKGGRRSGLTGVGFNIVYTTQHSKNTFIALMCVYRGNRFISMCCYNTISSIR